MGEKLEFLKEVFEGLTIVDIVDVSIIALVIYKMLGYIKDTSVWQLMKGIIVILVLTKTVCGQCHSTIYILFKTYNLIKNETLLFLNLLIQ